MPIYTRTGDTGTTHLGDGGRVSKDHPRIDACGHLDELSSVLGMIRAYIHVNPLPPDPSIDMPTWCNRIQRELFALRAEISCNDPEHIRKSIAPIGPQHIRQLEREIDTQASLLPPLRNFLFPGGHIVAAYTDLARTVCRRCERTIIRLSVPEKYHSIYIAYLNRLSDSFFMWSRYINHITGEPEQIWSSKTQ